MATDQTQFKYDVFLSFRGSDTRDNIIGHLYAALESRKIQTFMDDNLDRGQEIGPSVIKAIQESKVAVIVFSRNYADSPWCLDELAEILECKVKARMVVLPVFYRVDPFDVQGQSGEFGEGFQRLKEAEYSHDTLEKWSDALKKACDISGLDWTKYRSDHKLMEEIVESVLKQLRGQPLLGSLTVDRKLVGMQSQLERILPLLQTTEANVLFLGIWGMGGIGKTTCAEALMYHIKSDFEISYFLANVREESRKSTVICLRNEVLGKILGEEIFDKTPNWLPDHILNRLRKKKVLIILDDISSVDLLLTIAGDHDWYGPGSRIIVTSRDKQVLTCRADKLYKVEGLDYDYALQLFSSQAFKRCSPEGSHLELLQMVLDYARGVPLALKVLGSLLYKKHPEEWKSKLEKLRRIPEQPIMNVLQISYDELDEDEQNIFLDIACFFKGKDRDLVKDILDGCGFFASIGLSRLHDKCLINIVDNKLQMHDLIQEMGRDIVRKESKDYEKRSRLWEAEDILHLLTRNMGSELTQGMSLQMSKIEQKVNIQPDVFSSLHNLRLLEVCFSFKDFMSETSALSCCGFQYLPSSLRCLYWHGYPWKSLPSNFSLRNLVYLCICCSPIEHLWSRDKVSPQLKHINLTFLTNLVSLPDISSAINLQTLKITKCLCLKEFPKVAANIKELYLSRIGLEEWPQSIQFLNKLQLLKLEDCEEMRRLPDTLHLASLEKFILRRCPNLKRIPNIVGKNLKVLDLDGSGIEIMPSSIGCLTSLRELHLSCTNIKELPVSIGNLISLVKLGLRATRIEELPASIGNLPSLASLILNDTLLKGLPTSIGHLTSLVNLKLAGCESMNNLPSSICELKSVEIPTMHDCLNPCKLPSFHGLQSLTELDIGGCGIQELPENIGHLSTLRRLYLGATSVERIPLSIERLSLLEELHLGGCKRLQYLPKLPSLVSFVDSSNCSSLKNVDCSAIDAIEKFGQAPSSYIFIFSNCTHLEKSARDNITHLLRIDQDIETTLRKFSTTSKYPGFSKFKIWLPDTRIPDWFQHQNRGSRICASFSEHRYKMSSIGLALSVVVEFPYYSVYASTSFYIKCECDLTNHNGVVMHRSFDMCAWEIWNYHSWFECDHVFIWLVRDLHDSMESDETYLVKASFEFFASPGTTNFKVKMCGAHVVNFSNETNIQAQASAGLLTTAPISQP